MFREEIEKIFPSLISLELQEKKGLVIITASGSDVTFDQLAALSTLLGTRMININHDFGEHHYSSVTVDSWDDVVIYCSAVKFDQLLP